MGGWLSLLAARTRPLRVKGLLLIAPATDFVTRLMIPSLPAQALAALAQEGRWAMPSAYASEPTVLTQALLDDGAGHCLLPGPIPFAGPVRILQGQEDPDVPWRHALDTAAAIASGDVRLTLVKDGDHRLSRPQDLKLITDLLAGKVVDVAVRHDDRETALGVLPGGDRELVAHAWASPVRFSVMGRFTSREGLVTPPAPGACRSSGRAAALAGRSARTC
jgi:hypothetical protein